MDDDFFAPGGASEARAQTNVFDEVLLRSQPKQSSQPSSQPGSQPTSPPRADEDVAESTSVPAPVIAPSKSPAAPTTTSNAPEYQQKVQSIQKTINERTATADKATMEKEERQKKAAQAYIAEEKANRASKLKAVHEDHRKAQSDYEKKTADLKEGGAAWSSLGVVVDLKKPNQFSKKTDRMKQVLLHLETAQQTK